MRIIIAFFGAVMGGGVARICLDIVGSRGEGAASGLFTPGAFEGSGSRDRRSNIGGLFVGVSLGPSASCPVRAEPTFRLLVEAEEAGGILDPEVC